MKEDAIKLLNEVKDYQKTKEEIHFQVAIDLLRPLMKAMVKDDKPKWWDDLHQEMTFGIWKVIDTFKFEGNDDEKNSGRLLLAIRKAAESKRLNFLKSKYVRDTESYLSLDQIIEKQMGYDNDDNDDEQDVSNDSDGDLLIQTSEFDSESNLFEEAIISLSDKERIFLNEIMKVNFNLSEYARRKGVSRQSIAKKFSCIKEKLKKFILQGCQI